MFARSVVALACLALAGCGVNPVDPTDFLTIPLGPAPKLAVVGGADQTVQAGSEFGQPIRVRLTSAAGAPLASHTISFTFVEPNPEGSFGGVGANSYTNSDGIAEIKFKATKVGTFTVTAAYIECSTYLVVFCDGKEVRKTQVVVSGTTVPAGS